jgi:dephospho-CoA kinase
MAKSTRSVQRIPPPIVGIIGPIGSGKSSVAQLLQRRGAVLINADAIGHELLEHSVLVRRRIRRAFGNSVTVRGLIDRTVLARLAFATPANTSALNAIMRPPLVREVARRIRAGQKRRDTVAIVLDAALLLEWRGAGLQWDYLIGVWAPESVRTSRLRSRGLDAPEVRRRARGQLPWSRKRRQCDCLIKNDRTLSILRQRTYRCWEKMLSSCSRRGSRISNRRVR